MSLPSSVGLGKMTGQMSLEAHTSLLARWTSRLSVLLLKRRRMIGLRQ
jgi:hypothetical protein